ncbi:uncharacterized protein LOC123541103 [Mercenaria mercenaria]|uniref:uncharacterized protein LOC123541103 n=1 Tax=Mercenaria mercenaria TaxID=6596 RepID=UPI00234F5D5E|nr:uncharacterized protein LOC123541103 [Mercenaria mercenaria]
MLKVKDASIESSTTVQQTELSDISQIMNKYRKVDNSYDSKCAGMLLNQQVEYERGHEHMSIEKKAGLPLERASPSLLGSAVPDNFDLSLVERTAKSKAYMKMCKANKVNVSLHTSTTIYTRSRSHLESECIPSGLKQTVSKTNPCAKKDNKGHICEGSDEADRAITTKGKRRKKELLDKTVSSDVEYKSSRKYQIQEKENPERLLEAILALYGMSNVPETERPAVPKHSNQVSKEIRNEVFKISPTIKRMGYRYRTFYIYAVKPKCLADEEMRRKQICSVLKRYGIYRFEIAPCAENITEFMHVGEEIKVISNTPYSLRPRRVREPGTVKGGTLGCFVSMNDGEGQCGLLSKHVSEHCSDVYYVGKGNNKIIGHMLESTNKHQPNGLDISAALMNEPISEEGTMFKDTRQVLLKGMLYEYIENQEDAVCRSEQSVYIYGAKSNPGKGEITMPFIDNGLSTILIQVEDQVCFDGNRQGRFAEKGDSGAIVCVEDPHRKEVHAVSMVMGTPDLEDSPSARRTYLTIPLSKGLQQLQNDTGKQFKLC